MVKSARDNIKPIMMAHHRLASAVLLALLPAKHAVSLQKGREQVDNSKGIAPTLGASASSSSSALIKLPNDLDQRQWIANDPDVARRFRNHVRVLAARAAGVEDAFV